MSEPIVPVVEESIAVPPSEDNGNIPLETEEGGNGIPPVTPPNPVVEVPATDPSIPPVESELFELPDGRKVDAATLTKEWKENFLPDYTRKSQILADKGRQSDPNITTNPTDPFADPNFVPQSYAELAEAIRASTFKEIETREQKAADDRKAVEDAVTTQLTELKTSDPNLNENALFQHAVKYQFRDLKAAYQNMTDMNKLAKDMKVATAKDIQRRVDPVSSSPGATGAKLDPSQFATAVDFLRAQTGK